MDSSTEASRDRAFERGLVRLIPQVRAFARMLCRDATLADDVAQEAVAKAWSARESFTMGTNMKAWLFMILRNQFYSEQRRSWRVASLDPDVAARTLVATDNSSATVELDDVRRALCMLPDEQREALTLVGAAGLSYEEVSEIAGVAVGTIKSRVSRARVRIAQILAEGDLRPDGKAPHAAMADIWAQIDAYRARAA